MNESLEALTGKLLVASPQLDDSNFARTVILVCSHDAEGAFGLVLNRALEVPVAAAAPDWAVPLASPDVLFEGGPVGTSMLFALGEGRDVGAEAWSLAVLPGIGVLDLTRVERAVASGVTRSRVFAGYAGWGGGQLEGELIQEAWFVVEATEADIFSAHSERAWHVALERKVGPLAMYAFFADEPEA